jgi:putative Mg2+ transporter-C (MgtC) family protein
MLENLTFTNEILISLRVVVAAIFSFLIGLDRSRAKNDKAILRTLILVGMTSALVSSLSQILVLNGFNIDVSRMTAQIISGIGFLGMGVIIKTSDNHISGLTTATSVWAVACIGIATGYGAYILAAISTVLISVVLKTIKE